MPFSLREAVSVKGHGLVNEDEYCCLPEAAWVLDGASGVGEQRLPATTDAEWYVREFSAALFDQLVKAPGADSKALLRNAIRVLRHRYETALVEGAPEYPPSAAFIMAREKKHHVEICALGDCAAMCRTMEGSFVYTGGNDSAIDGASLSKLMAAQRDFPEASHDEIRERLAPALRENRALMNSPEGYWILSFADAAFNHMRIVEVDADRDSPVLLMTDGFLRGIPMLSHGEAELFYNLVLERGANEACKMIRGRESGDLSCRDFPRFKIHDDATCVVLMLDKDLS